MHGITPSSTPSEIDAAFQFYRRRVFVAITIGYGFLYTCRLALSVVKKPLIDEGIFTIQELGAIGAALFYGYALGKFINGFLADHVSPKIFFAAGLILSAATNLVMGWSTIVWLSIALWALNGWFQGYGAPSSVVTLTNWFSNRERGRYYGIWSAAHSIGEGVTFFVIAGIVGVLGWRWGFWTPGVLCILVGIWVYWFLQPRPQRLGLPSVKDWKRDSWSETPEQQSDRRSTIRAQLSVFRIPAIWVLALSSALMYVTRYAVNSWGILYLQEDRGYSLIDAGALISLSTVAGIVGAVAYGYTSDKLFSARRPPTNLMFAALEVLALFLIFYGPEHRWAIVSGFILYGVGLSGLLTSLGGLFAIDIAPGKAAGAALGFIGIFSYVGAAIQEVVSAHLINVGITQKSGLRLYDFEPAITFWVGASVLSMLLAASLWRARVRD